VQWQLQQRGIVRVCTCACMHVCTCACMHVHMCVHMCACSLQRIDARDRGSSSAGAV